MKYTPKIVYMVFVHHSYGTAVGILTQLNIKLTTNGHFDPIIVFFFFFLNFQDFSGFFSGFSFFLQDFSGFFSGFSVKISGELCAIQYSLV